MDKASPRIIASALLTMCAACSGSQSGDLDANAAATGTEPQGGQSSATMASRGASTSASNFPTGGSSLGRAEKGGASATNDGKETGGAPGSGSTRHSSVPRSTGGTAQSGASGAETTGTGRGGANVIATGTKRGTSASSAGGTTASGGTGGGVVVAGGNANGSAATTAGGGSVVATNGTPSSGCGKSPTLKSGSRTIQSGDQSRQFMISIPDDYDNNHPYRLIFAFHWNGGTMGDIDGGGTSGDAWSYYGLREQANGSTIFVAPQGIGNGWANSGGRDLQLVDDLIALIEGDLCIDTSQLFSLGFSYGGGMTYELACARPMVFRAVAVYSGAQLSGCDGGKQPVAYLGIHGISDGTCNIGGGRGLRDTFVKNNGCTAQNPEEPSAGSRTHVCTKYQGCSSGHPVQWCAFDGGHTPGNVDGGGDDGAKTWTKLEVWKFFTQFQ